MNPNQALWEKGDFTLLAETMRQSSEEFVVKLGVGKEMKVLDLACGDGSTAIPEARSGAEVTGIDIARNLVEAGNRRIKEEGIPNCIFKEGDACNLVGIEDATFDMVVSVFGAMFAPNPMDVAKEMVRVTKPGGKIVMANWIPDDPTLVAQLLKIVSAYTPPPPEGFVSPMTWGVKANVIERFENAGVPEDKITFTKDTFTFRAPYSPQKFVSVFRNWYGPTMNAFEEAEKNGRSKELQNELENLFLSQNESKSPNSLIIPATFLKVTVYC